MNAVVRLMLTYFTRTPGLRWLSLAGIVAIAAGAIVLPRVAPTEVTSTIAFLGCVSLFVGASVMPMMVMRMVQSHALCTLPFGRLKVFASALLTVAVVSVPLPFMTVLLQSAAVPKAMTANFTTWHLFSMAAHLFWSFYVTTFFVATGLYAAIGFATGERNTAGLAKCLLIVIAVIYLPSARIVALDPKMQLTTWESGLSWIAIGVWMAFAPRWRAARARGGKSGGALARGLGRLGRQRYPAGREFELMLGVAHPLWVALALLFPIAIQSLVGFRLSQTWLFYLTLFSAISGALAGRAAERARPLWLRARWSRGELFARVERAFWKHNVYVLALLLVLLITIVRLYDLPERVVPLGIPLLVVSMVVSTYLGLAMTRGLHALEATAAIVSMLALMGVAVLAATNASTALVIACEIVFALFAVFLRFAARRRWHTLDWALCRVDRSEHARMAS